ncbi:MAG: serine kinase [Deltaproteobacteria bacterium]|nr:MAG: serine kinase [Deltaproteobacteria bacterium]
MKLKELVEKLDLEVKSASGNLETEVTGGYVSDLLSDVMANCKKGDIWVTLQIHPNIAAVGTLKELAGIIINNSREPEEETLKKAEGEALPILISKLPAFELVGRMYELGISGLR